MAIEPNTRGSNPAENAAAVTPHDSNDLTNVARALYVGTTGNIKIITAGGDTVTLNSVPAGAIIPVRVKRVFSTGTSASNIVSIF
jgi:hypothetical protein